MNLKLFKTLTQEQRDFYWEDLPLGITYIKSRDKVKSRVSVDCVWSEHTYTEKGKMVTTKNSKGNWWKYYYGDLRGHACDSSHGLFINERSVTEQEFNEFIRGLE